MAAGLMIPVSVNIAAHHLQQPDFVDRLRILLSAHPNIRPSCLELEILETSALRDVAQVSHVLAACRELGVSIALDDFGTGYSSLTYFKRLPVNLLKIDRSFVRDVLDDPEDLNILEGVLGLATAFDRVAIAEGVETVDHGRLLLQLGCVYGQGNGIAWPMPGEDLPAWSAAWNPDPAWALVASVAPRKRSLVHAAVAIAHGLRPWPPSSSAGAACRRFSIRIAAALAAGSTANGPPPSEPPPHLSRSISSIGKSMIAPIEHRLRRQQGRTSPMLKPK